MAKWMEGFELITSSVKVDGDDKSDNFDDHYACTCKPEFAGGPICVDRSCLNFCMQVECIRCRAGCQNNRFQRRKYAKLDVRETPGKGHGLFACEDLKKGQFLMEYLGELVSSAELQARMDAAKLDKHLYVLQVKAGNFIDARNKGTIGRFINHSCEPNCVTELWTVDDRIRVGIFASKDVEKDTELSFDYKWTPSNRPPTKCNCGTPSCRGFLEIMTQQELDENKVRKGVWRSRKDDLAAIREARLNSTSTSAGISEETEDTSSGGQRKSPLVGHGTSSATSGDNYVFDDNGRLIPQRLVQKRVKIWWEGNQTYFEADVIDYIERTNRYVCYYIVDETTAEENLSDPKSDWFWLDETQEEVIIKKKEIPMFVESDVVEDVKTDAITETPGRSVSGSNLASTSGAAAGTSRAQPAFVQTSRGVVRVQFQTALQVVNVARKLSEEQQRQRLAVWTNLFSLLKEFYQVDAQFLLNDKAPDFVSQLEVQDTQQIVLIGGEDLVKRAKEGLITAHETYLAQRMNEDQLKREEQYNKQSVILTNEWRLMPTLSGSSSSSGSSSFRKQAPISQTAQRAVSLLTVMSFDNAATSSSPASSAHLIHQNLLPKVSVSHSIEQDGEPHPGQASTESTVGSLSEKVHRTLLQHLQGLTRRLNYSQSVSYGSLCLLIRYLRFCDDKIVKDTTSLIAAVVVLTLKSRTQFKFRMLSKLVQSAYCQVFGREETSIGHSADTFIPKVLDFESVIYSKLFSDVFVPDVDAPLFSSAYEQARVQMIKEADASAASSESSHHQHHHHKHKKSSESHAILSVMHSSVYELLDEGYKLASILMCQYHTLLVVLPSDILQLCCLIIISMMECLLTPNSILRYMMITSKETPGVLLTCLLRFASHHSDAVTKSVEVLVSLISKNLANINGVKCFTLKDRFESSPMAVLIADCLPKLFARWLKLVQESDAETIATQKSTVTVLQSTTPSFAPPPPPPPTLPAALMGQCRPPPPMPPQSTAQSSSSAAAPARALRPEVKSITGLGFKNRLPWITEDSVARSNLLLADLSEVATVGKDLYHGLASIEGVLRLNAGHVVNHVGFIQQPSQAVPVSFRAWPPLKSLIRDIKKSGVSHPSELGTTSGAMNELCLLQHLHHHFNGPASTKQSTPRKPAAASSSCPYFIEPFGILTIPPSEWHQPATSQMLFGNKFDANHEYLDSLREADESTSTSYQPSASVYSSSGATTYSSESVLSLLQDDSKQSAMLTSQLNALKEKKYALPEVSLSFLVMAPVQLVLSSVLGSSSSDGLSSAFAVQLCKDLLCAADHLIHCGVHLKFLSLDHLFISPDGRLLLGSLAGAVLENAEAHNSDATNAESEGRADGKPSKHHKESREKKSSSSSGMSTVSSSCWYTVAPEILLGGSPSPDSTVYSVGIVVAQILTGKPLIKNASGEEKQLQYIFKVLGTPKVVGYREYDQLPQASVFGKLIRADDGSMTESRTRVFKVAKSLCPSSLLTHCSYSPGEESDGGGVMDLIRSAVHLVPYRRQRPAELLSLRIFHNYLSLAQSSRTTVDQYTKGEWTAETLFLSKHESVLVHCMSHQSRMAAVTQLVKRFHRDNEKEHQWNQTLVKLANEQYPVVQNSASTSAVSSAAMTPAVSSRPAVATPSSSEYSGRYTPQSRGDYYETQRAGSGSDHRGYSQGYSGGGDERNAYGKRFSPQDVRSNGNQNHGIGGGGYSGQHDSQSAEKMPRYSNW